MKTDKINIRQPKFVAPKINSKNIKNYKFSNPFFSQYNEISNVYYYPSFTSQNEQRDVIKAYYCKYPELHGDGRFIEFLNSGIEKNPEFALFLLDNEDLSFIEKEYLISKAKFYPELQEPMQKYLQRTEGLDKYEFCKLIVNHQTKAAAKKLLLESDMDALDAKLLHQENLIKKYPEKYINGDFNPNQIEKSHFLTNKNLPKYYEFMTFAAVTDSETLDFIFRKRLGYAFDLTEKVAVMNIDELDAITKLNHCSTPEGKPLTVAQKVDFIELIDTYTNLGKSTKKLIDMVGNKKVDIPELKRDILSVVMAHVGVNIENVSNEKLLEWNLDYIHKVIETFNASSYQDKQALRLLMYGANKGNFKKFITRGHNDWSADNRETEERFKQLNLNYDMWLNPPRRFEKFFISADNKDNAYIPLAEKIEEDVELLRKTPAKNYIDKQLKPWINDDKFIVPQSEYRNAKALKNYNDKICELLDSVWARAIKNNKSGKNLDIARQSLTILNHFNNRCNSLEKMVRKEENTIPSNKSLNLTIKMWDRIPQKDLFQGNYSTCCIGMGNINGFAMPTYLLSTAFNMIELVDNNSGKIIGNALCYFVKDKYDNPSFMIDNIEINNSVQPSKVTGIKLRNAIAKYASDFAIEVSGNKYIDVCLGQAFNDVPEDDFDIFDMPYRSFKLVGDLTTAQDIYLDAFGGWVDENIACDEDERYITKKVYLLI